MLLASPPGAGIIAVVAMRFDSGKRHVIDPA